jgi:hypothetical protein
MTPPREPSIFISHKHADRGIADAVREFIFRTSNREVSVFQSSAADSDNPDLGRILTSELKEALWKTAVVILVYTTEDQDWQWCMWECGVATTPTSPDTRIIVFQCSVDAPRVFQDAVRVNVREREDLLKFVNAFLTSAQFFPGLGRALAPKLAPTGDEVRKATDALHDALGKVVPQGDVAEWAAQPLIQLQLPLETIDKIAAEVGIQLDQAIQVADVAVVSYLDPQAKQIFGLASLAPGTTLSGLGMRWAEGVPGAAIDWVRDIETQVRRAARNEIPAIGWGYLQSTDGSSRYIALLSRARRIPSMRSTQFDVNLVPFDELAATRVLARMLPLHGVVCHRLDRVPLRELKVVDLARRFRDERLSRMPFLTNDNRVKLVVHRSMIDRYIAEKVTSGTIQNIVTLSIADVMDDDPTLRALFETSFASVGPTARLREVNAIMAGNYKVQDVFVTSTGNLEDPIMGWITNTMLAQHLA